MQIEIIGVTNSTKAGANGRSYNQLDVAYKDNQGKVVGKKIMDFTYKDTYNTLKSATSGQVYEVETVKNEKSGYWDWKSATLSTAFPSAQQIAPPSKGTPVGKSTYETPEERAIKQVYIVRQSSISNAIEVAKANKPKGGIEVNEILDLARAFESYVFDKDVPKQETPFDSLPDDIPY